MPNKTLILKVAFVIIRRLQKPHYSSKTKIIYQKQTHIIKNSKNSDSSVSLLSLKDTAQLNSEFFVDLSVIDQTLRQMHYYLPTLSRPPSLRESVYVKNT
jgi:hypothetical protein